MWRVLVFFQSVCQFGGNLITSLSDVYNATIWSYVASIGAKKLYFGTNYNIKEQKKIF